MPPPRERAPAPGRPAPTAAEAAPPAAGHPLLDLQDAAGNRATSQLVHQVSRPADPGAAELTQFVVDQRGFASARPGQVPEIDPHGAGPRGGLGTGYSTNAAVVVRDAEGVQVAADLGRYAGGSDLHAEAQAVQALRARLPQGSVAGGDLLVAVDQVPCPNCQARLLELAEWVGARRVVAVGPSRPGPSGAPVSPKTAARTATRGTAPGRPPVEPVAPAELWSAELPARGPARGPSGGASGLFSVALGFLYAFAHERAAERERDEEGYAPVGALQFADEGLLSRLGRWIADPFLDTQADLGERLNVPVWRDTVRRAVAAHEADGVLTVTFQVVVAGGVLQEVRDIPVTYRRGPGGRWRGQPAEPFPPGIAVPDLDRIVDPDVTDAQVRSMLEHAPDSA